MGSPPCRVCGHDRYEIFLSDYQVRGRSWNLITCLSCGLISTDPLPSDDVLNLRYTEVYWAAASDRSVSVMYNMRMKGFARRLRKMAHSGNRALDVGAGNGAWVKLLISHGFDAVGIDPYAADLSGGLVLKCGLEEAPFGKEYFDLVSFLHVLEHLKDPRGAIKTADRLLKPGGLLVVEVPNIASLGFKMFPRRWFPLDDIPSHISHFNRQSLLTVVRRAGEYELILDSGFSGKDSPSILANTLFPGLSPREVRQRNAGCHPIGLKVLYLLAQMALLPAAWVAAWAGRGEVVRLVLKKHT